MRFRSNDPRFLDFDWSATCKPETSELFSIDPFSLHAVPPSKIEELYKDPTIKDPWWSAPASFALLGWVFAAFALFCLVSFVWRGVYFRGINAVVGNWLINTVGYAILARVSFWVSKRLHRARLCTPKFDAEHPELSPSASDQWKRAREELRILAREALDLWREEAGATDPAPKRGRDNPKAYTEPRVVDEIERRHDHLNNPLRSQTRRKWAVSMFQSELKGESELAKQDPNTIEQILEYYWDADHQSYIAARAVVDSVEALSEDERSKQTLQAMTARITTLDSAESMFSEWVTTRVAEKEAAGMSLRELTEYKRRLDSLAKRELEALAEKFAREVAKE